MTAFRVDFYGALQELLQVVEYPILQDTLPVAIPSNLTARLLRHGVAVSTFSMLERYIRLVFDELLYDVSRGVLTYSNFPDSMRKFIIVDSVVGLANQLGFMRDSSARISHADTHIFAISKYKSNPPTYTAHGFSPKGSNVGHEDIKQAFAAFGLKDAWGRMDALATRIGGAMPSLNNEFKLLSEARNLAAHDPVSSIPIADLRSHIQSAITIAICCDIIAKNVGAAIRTCTDARALTSSIEAFFRPVRFLDEQIDGTWLERATPTHRAVKRYRQKADGIAGAVARVGVPFVVLRNTRLLPIELFG